MNLNDMELINSEINRIKELVFKLTNKKITNEMAFNYLIMHYYYFDEEKLEVSINYIVNMVTDGKHDGGIDFVYYDEENVKVIVSQSKLSKNLRNNEIIEELNKMSNTIENFKKFKTGVYNSNLKRELQNALDRLPDDKVGNVEYIIFTISEIDKDQIYKIIDNQNSVYSKEMVSLYQAKDILNKIQSVIVESLTIDEGVIKIDEMDNMLKYSTTTASGIIVNMNSQSLETLYKAHDERLFDCNIRSYVANKIVDDGIKKTLDEERENFWFLNNGLIIICSEYITEENVITIYNYSIVNGGQTTRLIGNYEGENLDEFYIPCKIIKVITDKNGKMLLDKIPIASNAQKAILPRDLKANTPEMKKMKYLLEANEVFLEIKRGDKKAQKGMKYKIKNDDLAQIILSFVNQQPGTSRSAKKSIFENDPTYNSIFKVDYLNNENKKIFLLDLVELNYYYQIIERELSKKGLTNQEVDVIRNGKQIVFALLGVLYRLSNYDIDSNQLLSDPQSIKKHSFVYSSFISNYKGNDLEELLRDIIILLIQSINDSYITELQRGTVTSISNYFKTDKQYFQNILLSFIKEYNRTKTGKELKSKSIILKRNQ